MGHISKDLRNIPEGYDNYLLFLPSELENESQKIMDSDFIHLSKAVGRDTLIVYLYGDEENKSIIDGLQLQGKRFPMLFYMDKRPLNEMSLINNDGCISFELGMFRDKYSLMIFLEKICWFVQSYHAKRDISWIKKKDKFLKIVRPLSRSIPYIGETIEGFLPDT